MKLYVNIFILILIGFTSCGLIPGPEDYKDGRRKKDLKRTLIAENGGEEYVKEMSEQLNAKKFTRYLEDDIDYAVNMYDSELKIIIDSLNCSESEWRKRYFDVINQVYHIETLKKFYPEVEEVILTTFLSHPKEVLNRIGELAFIDSDFWTERISNKLKDITSDSTITIISATNLAISNCTGCTTEEEQNIADFISYLGNM